MKNDSAFPRHVSVEAYSRGHRTNNPITVEGGLTKRELFAAMAMQGLIAGCYGGNNVGFTVSGNCVAAVEYADALIAELAKGADK